MMCLLIGFGQVRADSRWFKVAERVQNGQNRDLDRPGIAGGSLISNVRPLMW